MAPLVVFAAMAAMQAMAGNQQAAALREQAKRKQMIADMNAEFAEADAWEAEQQGFTDTARYQAIIDGTVGTQRVAYAAQNVDINYGTAAEVQTETRLTGLLNTLDIQKQARQKAMGFKKEANNLRMGGESARSQGDSDALATQQAGYLTGANTAVTGYSKNSSSSKTTAPMTAEKSSLGNTWSLDGLSAEYRKGNLKADSDRMWG